MKKYNTITSNKLVISTSENYLLEDDLKDIEILVKSGVDASILTYNKNDQINLKIMVEKDANLSAYHIIETTTNYDINENIKLIDEGANASVMAVMLATNDAAINSKISIFHDTKNTTSELLTYAVVRDNTNIVIDNNAYIKKGASNSNARQSAKGLSLSKTASILVDPNLFIDEYDVMASHGVAMGSINKDDLFYLMSRGLTKEEASNMVIMGLIEPVLRAIDNEEYANHFRDNFQNNLK